MAQMHSHVLVPAPEQILERYRLEPELSPRLCSSARVELTQERADQLCRAFRDTKRSIAYKLDPPGKDTWGKLTYRWYRGLSGWILRREGDCDDYAVEFLRVLLDMGWPRGAMRLARAKLGPNNRHLVLGVDFGGNGTIILDNTKSGLVRFGALAFASYEWEICEEIGWEHWARIGDAAPLTLADLVNASLDEGKVK